MVTWKDWWASRTIRFNSYMATMWASLFVIIPMIDEAALTAFGVSPTRIAQAMAVIGIIKSLHNNQLRAATTKPLEGRSTPEKETK